MRITVLCVGKVKESYFTGAISEYAKRLGRYCRLELTEVADEKTPDGAYVVALAIEGTQPDSLELSAKLARLATKGVSHIVFLIGGSLGLSEEVMKRADEAMSFSRLTFPHQLMRVLLLEQVYRAYRIMNHEPYHK